MKRSQTTTRTNEDLVSFYKEMLFYRRFEEQANLAYTQQKFAGFCHLHIGQEALCVGVQRALRDDDYMISGYRSHTQAMAKGIPAQEVFAELLGKATGCSHGRGGSMHMFSAKRRFLGGHGIVGGQAPIAVGVGFKIEYQKEDSICVCYLGDAAMNQGQVYEAMNMAATWKLPVLFIIENNLYGMGTAISRTTNVKRLSDRAQGLGLEGIHIDAMDVVETHQHMVKIVDKVRLTRKPILLEAMTYRYKGHSVADPGTYRSKEEVEEYKERDPITTLGTTLVQKKMADEATLETWDEEARAAVKVALRFAEESPAPDAGELFRHVYKEEGDA